MRGHVEEETTLSPRANFRDINTGLTFEELAGTTFNSYRFAAFGAGTQLPPWHELGEGRQNAWARVVMELDGAFNERESVSWLTLASLAHQAYGEPAGTFEAEAPAVKLCWVAAVRHLANMLDWERDDDQTVETHEMHWQQWTERQLNKDFVLQEGEKKA
jgi:hypothetical protein